MAKRQRNHEITTAFNYLVKSVQNGANPEDRVEEGFTEDEFARVVARISDITPLDDEDDEVIAAIKLGDDLPFNYYETPDNGLHFGDFEGAYYGQKYRNNRLGTIDADSLNLRPFHYLITHLRDGKILIGVTYHGLYGDYDGLRNCLTGLLRGNYRVASKTLKSVSGEIGRGQPISLKLTYRKNRDRAERRSLFGSSGVIAIKNTDVGEDFEERVAALAVQARGTIEQRKRAIARLVNQDELLELDEDDIVGCSAIIRDGRRQRTVYFIGENNFSTRFPLAVDIDRDGVGDREQIKREMIRVMREDIIPLLA